MPFIEWDQNGETLRYHYLEAGKGEALVLCHGFTGSAENWLPVMETLSARRRVLAFDLPGHGQTKVPPGAAYTMPEAVKHIAHALDQIGLVNVDLLGYSMGGRFALAFAVANPQRVRQLVLESASPGLRSPDEWMARKQADDALANRIEDEGLERFVDYWEQLPLWDSQQQLPQTLRRELRALRLRNDPAGLAYSLRGMGTGVMPPLWDALPSLSLPVLLLVGEYDTKFQAINAAMHEALPDSTLTTILGAGHTIHLEQPTRYVQALRSFLKMD